MKHRRMFINSLGAIALLVSTSAAHATPEERCQSGRAIAAARYASCEQKAAAKFDLTSDVIGYAVAAGKCVTTYAATWAKLQAKASGSGATCDNSRFGDNGDATVTDRLTALQWEKKDNLDGTPNPADPHDADNQYTWSAGGAGFTAADGTAFTGFLAALNSGGCFAGQCDWRLPTRDELLTIATPPYPACTTGPCIDPTFGPTVAAAGYYWSATTDASGPNGAWNVNFFNGIVLNDFKGNDHYVRAVRAGL